MYLLGVLILRLHQSPHFNFRFDFFFSVYFRTDKNKWCGLVVMVLVGQ